VPEEIIVRSVSSRESIDDKTVAYIVGAQKYFEDLRQIAAQLAGLLVLAAAGGKSATPDHPMLEAAELLHESASAGIRGSRATTGTHIRQPVARGLLASTIGGGGDGGAA